MNILQSSALLHGQGSSGVRLCAVKSVRISSSMPGISLDQQTLIILIIWLMHSRYRNQPKYLGDYVENVMTTYYP